LYHDPRLSTAPIGRCWQVAWRLCPPIRVCRITLASNPTATGAETADGPRPRNAHSTRRNCRSSRIQLKLGLSQDTRAVRRYRQSASTCDPRRCPIVLRDRSVLPLRVLGASPAQWLLLGNGGGATISVVSVETLPREGPGNRTGFARRSPTTTLLACQERRNTDDRISLATQSPYELNSPGSFRSMLTAS
jgi:hypothetical protein